MFLLQGVFWQAIENAGFDHKRDEVVVRRGHFTFAFAGAIDANPPDKKPLEGWMLDIFGRSRIFDIELTDGTLSFKKQYHDRDDVITYSFRKQGSGTLVGFYQGEAVGRDFARCILTEVSDEFFQPPPQ